MGTGAIFGAISAALCGGDVIRGIVSGAVMGGIAGVGVAFAPAFMAMTGVMSGTIGMGMAFNDMATHGINACNFFQALMSGASIAGGIYGGLSGFSGGGFGPRLAGVTANGRVIPVSAQTVGVVGNTGVTTVAGTLGVLSLMASTGGGNNSTPTRIEISRSRHPEAADHIEDAQNAGHPKRLTIDRAGKDARRAAALEGYPLKPGFDRDEYPPAVFKEGGAGASVRYIKIFDNRGAGSILRWAIDGLPDGTIVIIEVVP